MPPNILDGNDLDRGRRFEKICQELFVGVTNVEIGRILAGYEKEDGSAKGYSEGSIRRWKAGGPIGATALLNLQRLGVNLEYLLEGKQNSPSTNADEEKAAPFGLNTQKPSTTTAEGKELSPEIEGFLDVAATIEKAIHHCLMEIAMGKIPEAVAADWFAGLLAQVKKRYGESGHSEAERKTIA